MDAVTLQVPPGTRFGPYAVVEPLGRGGMAQVYVAERKVLHKRVALKPLLPRLAEDATTRARFLREGQATSRIQHPHVVAIHDVAFEGAVPYLVMDLLEGEDLSRRLGRGPLSIAETLDVMMPIIDVVATAPSAVPDGRGAAPRKLSYGSFLDERAHEMGVHRSYPPVLIVSRGWPSGQRPTERIRNVMFTGTEGRSAARRR